MNTYFYKAKKNNAETVTGQISAHSEDEAVELISQLGMVAVSVILQEDVLNKSKKFKNIKISSKEMVVFSQQLATLIKSGVSILNALEIIRRQMKNAYFQLIIGQMVIEIKNGCSLSDAMSEYPKVFSLLYVTMVKAGENSSNLREMLLNMTAHQKKQEEFFSKVRMAMAYPLLMLVVGSGTIYFILTFVLPKMMGLFQNLKGGLPWTTRGILALSYFFNNYWYVGFALLLGGIVFYRYMSNTEKGRMLKSRLMLKVPLFGDMLLKADLARFCRTLHLLLNSGLQMVRAFPIAVPVLGNEVLKKHLEGSQSRLTAGESLGDIMRDIPSCPEMVGYMISVGEEAGSLDNVLAEIAEHYEQEVDEQVKVVTTLLEPIMILVVGGIIGLIVFSILLPIFQVDVFSY